MTRAHMARVEIWELINIHNILQKKKIKQTKISDEIVDTSHNDSDLYVQTLHSYSTQFATPSALQNNHLCIVYLYT